MDIDMASQILANPAQQPHSGAAILHHHHQSLTNKSPQETLPRVASLLATHQLTQELLDDEGSSWHCKSPLDQWQEHHQPPAQILEQLPHPSPTAIAEREVALAESAPLLTLPLHLVSKILCELGNISQLHDVLLSHPIFYAAFRDTPALASNLLKTQFVDDEIFILAIIAHESTLPRRRRRRMSRRRFLLAYRDDPSRIASRYHSLTLVDAVLIGKLHETVLALEKEFVQAALGAAGNMANGLDNELQDATQAAGQPLSLREHRRVCRALYRFQIYCNMFARQPGPEKELKRMFFDRHAPWVNEQLGCLYDFLERKIQNSYYRVTRDEAKGSSRTLDDNSHFLRIQWHLSRGLHWIRTVALAEDGQLHEILDAADVNLDTSPPSPPEDIPEDRLSPPNASLGSSCALEMEQPPVAVVSLASGPGPVQILELHRAPVTDEYEELVHDRDGDDGPYLSWKESRGGGSQDMFVVLDHGVSLRRMGYVMWDRTRLEAEPCRAALSLARIDETPAFASKDRFMDIMKVWEKRFKRKPPRKARMPSIAGIENPATPMTAPNPFD